MAQLIEFEQHALARLRERLGAAEEANEDLIAFARGHSGAVATIHEAVLAVMEAASVDAVLEVVARRWPHILGIDAAVIALVVGDRGFLADSRGVHRVEAAFVERHIAGRDLVEVRSVERGHPLFGGVARTIRAEALIRIDSAQPLPQGLLALGQRAELDLDSKHGSELLLFLGRAVVATLRRCVATS
ncbi:MAG TPA: DUF484 family protein [Sphingomicrobium sp.]|nr:DUF484 family protein [Sphingomicrobium sp.]